MLLLACLSSCTGREVEPWKIPLILCDPLTAHILAYLDGLYPGGHLRQAKVNGLRERWSSRAVAVHARIETQSASGGAVSLLHFAPLETLRNPTGTLHSPR